MNCIQCNDLSKLTDRFGCDFYYCNAEKVRLVASTDGRKFENIESPVWCPKEKAVQNG